MPELALLGRRILIVEDEYLLAEELMMALSEAGAQVMGPAGFLPDALSLIGDGNAIDAAVLDVHLRGEMVFPAADLLFERGTPFVFTTGFDASMIPKRFAQVSRCEKPLDMNQLIRAVAKALAD